ncbi:MAG: anti-CBASS protein Acb1 family protein, partial [Vulcanimicrobiaceae bacterium]
SVARIPAVKMFGIQPKGLNATSEGELRAFNDTIHGAQEHLFRAHLTTVYDIMQISLWGERDPDITYDFLPLQEPTPKEKADILKSDADRLQVLVDAGLISQEEGRTVLVNNPESGFDGLDPDDVPDLLSEEETGLIPQGAGRGLEAELEEAEGSVAGEDEAETQIANAPPAGEATGKIRRDIDGDDQPTEAEARRQAIVTGGGKDGAGRDE